MQVGFRMREGRGGEETKGSVNAKKCPHRRRSTQRMRNDDDDDLAVRVPRDIKAKGGDQGRQML